jgi:hypothetical protein
MSISKLSNYRRRIISFVFLPLLAYLLHVPAFASQKIEGDIRVENIEWIVQEGAILITYDIIGPLAESYDVEIVLLREKDKSFRFVPKAVIGDIGAVKSAGLKKQIRWQYKKDFPQGLQGDDFYFEVTVDQVGGSSWFLYVLGIAAVGGGAAYFAMKKSDNPVSSPTTDATTGLPTPPIRPLQ